MELKTLSIIKNGAMVSYLTYHTVYELKQSELTQALHDNQLESIQSIKQIKDTFASLNGLFTHQLLPVSGLDTTGIIMPSNDAIRLAFNFYFHHRYGNRPDTANEYFNNWVIKRHDFDNAITDTINSLKSIT